MVLAYYLFAVSRCRRTIRLVRLMQCPVELFAGSVNTIINCFAMTLTVFLCCTHLQFRDFIIAEIEAMQLNCYSTITHCGKLTRPPKHNQYHVTEGSGQDNLAQFIVECGTLNVLLVLTFSCSQVDERLIQIFQSGGNGAFSPR